MAKKLYRVSIDTTAMIEAETETEALELFLGDLSEDDCVAECESDDDDGQPFAADVSTEEEV